MTAVPWTGGPDQDRTDDLCIANEIVKSDDNTCKALENK